MLKSVWDILFKILQEFYKYFDQFLTTIVISVKTKILIFSRLQLVFDLFYQEILSIISIFETPFCQTDF